MNLKEFKKIFIDLLDSHDIFILTTHEQSDGDGVGAEYAMCLYLETMGKHVTMINDDKPSKHYEFLDFGQKVYTQLEIPSEDAIIMMLDYNEINRIGKKLIPLITSGNQILRIDHHKKPEDIANCISYIDDTASSTCELVFNIINEDLIKFPATIQSNIAQSLYAGIIYDTNNFVNKNVSSWTFEVCSYLRKYGVDNNLAYNKIFENRTTEELILLGKSLSNIEEYYDGSIVMYMTTLRMLQDSGLSLDVTEGFTKDVSPVNGRDVVVYIRETGRDTFRVSLRSSHRDVQKIAEHFGGGGHILASGFRANMPIEDLKSELLTLLK